MKLKQLSDVKWGWVKDKPDLRDFPAKKLIYAEMPLPSKYFVNPNQPIYNQGQTSACVGFASAGVKSDEELIQHGGSYLFDGLDLYNQCKKIDGIPDEQGTYPRFALKILQEQGIKQLGLPCTKKRPNSFWEIGSYFRIEADATIDFVKQILLQYGSIISASFWYTNWMNVKDVFPVPDYMVGAHAYKICGWSASPAGFFVTNSWGKTLWGKAGVAIMPYEIFINYVLRLGGDVWKLVDK